MVLATGSRPAQQHWSRAGHQIASKLLDGGITVQAPEWRATSGMVDFMLAATLAGWEDRSEAHLRLGKGRNVTHGNTRRSVPTHAVGGFSGMSRHAPV